MMKSQFPLPPPAEDSPAERRAATVPAEDLGRAIASAWNRHAQRVHYKWPMGFGGHAALQTPQIMAEDSFYAAVREVVLALPPA